jgi:hypothetical protein
VIVSVLGGRSGLNVPRKEQTVLRHPRVIADAATSRVRVKAALSHTV